MKKYLLLIIFCCINGVTFGQFLNKNIISPEVKNIEQIESMDIDGDADNDLLFTTAGNTLEGGIIGWYENMNGAGQFSEKYHFVDSTFRGFQLLVAGDLDGDADSDFVISNRSNEIAVFKNEGGIFEKELLPIDSNILVEDLLLEDWDLDGDLDILASYYHDEQLLFFENEAGTFTNGIIIAEGEKFTNPILADFDGDGDVDMIIGLSFAPAKLSFYERIDGTLMFEEEVLIDNALGAVDDLEAVDLDSDGDMDFVYVKFGVVGWFENLDGFGNFASPAIISNSFPNNTPRRVKTTDIDADGDVDLLISTYLGVQWLENLNGTGVSWIANDLMIDMVILEEMQLTDLDGDGELDIVACSSGDNKISWVERTGIDEFSEEIMVTENLANITDIQMADMDSDGDKDLVATGRSSDRIAWFENMDNNGYFGDRAVGDEGKTIGIIDNPTAMEIADFDADGDLDLVSTTSYGSQLLYFQNADGAGNFAASVTISDIGENVYSLASTFVNADGTLDLLIAKDNSILWYNDVANLSLGTGVTIIDDMDGIRQIMLKDMDDDGMEDLLVASSQAGTIHWLRKTETLPYYDSPVLITENVLEIKQFIFADMDEDGDEDIVVIGSEFPSYLTWFENLDNSADYGTGISIQTSMEGAMSIVASDYDLDGDMDLIAASIFNSTIRLYENKNNTAEFSEGQINPLKINSISKMIIEDIDSDGDEDLFIATTIDNIIGLENMTNFGNGIAGKVFLDENENGLLDATEIGLFNQNVLLDPNPVEGWTFGDGNYRFATGTGDYNISTIIEDIWDTTTDLSYPIEITNPDDLQIRNFGLKPAGINFNAAITMTSAPTRCSFVVPFWLTYSNKGNQSANGIVTFELDPLVTFISANPMPDLIDGNVYSWFFEELSPSYSDDIQLQLEMPSADFIGETVHLLTEVQFEDTDGATLTTAEYDFSAEINCAYDPNDKMGEPNYADYPNYVLSDQPLFYTIRFQNTGTDTAINITILDYLDENLDWSTFEVVTASHDYETILAESGQVSFIFSNIYLPDSIVNEVESHGFIKYQIHLKNGLEDYVRVENEAEIYFDFNEYILTNRTENVKVTKLPIDLSTVPLLCFDEHTGQIQVDFPTTDFQFNWNNGLNGNTLTNLAAGDYSLVVTNFEGQVVADTSFILDSPPPIAATFTTEPENGDNQDGSAVVIPTGGVAPYAYAWNTNPVQSTNTAINLSTGTYLVTITDTNVCSHESTVFVDNTVGVDNLTHLQTFSLYPNPTDEKVKVNFQLDKVLPWRIQIFDTKGSLLNTFTGRSSEESIALNELDNGVYLVVLFANGESVGRILVVEK